MTCALLWAWFAAPSVAPTQSSDPPAWTTRTAAGVVGVVAVAAGSAVGDLKTENAGLD